MVTFVVSSLAFLPFVLFCFSFIFYVVCNQFSQDFGNIPESSQPSQFP